MFTPRDPGTSASALTDLRSGGVNEPLVSRDAYGVAGEAVEEIVFGQTDDFVYESYIVNTPMNDVAIGFSE